MKRHWKKVVIGLVALVALVFAASFIYAKWINDPPAKKTEQDAIDIVQGSGVPGTDATGDTATGSTDGAGSWQRVETGSQSSVADFVALDGRVFAVGLDGVSLDSRDGGASFELSRRADRLSLTAAVATTDGGVVRFSRAGLVRD